MKSLSLLCLFLLLEPLGARTHALLIGIADYRGTGLPDLQGPPNDLALMQTFLENHYEDLSLTMLRDGQATHREVLAALERLHTVSPQDTVFIYFSGHGSRTCDLNGDEPNGYDVSWVTHGARRGARLTGSCTRPPDPDSNPLDNYDLIDDELNAYLAEIPTEKIILISDSCHSGSITRDDRPVVLSRGGDFDPRPHPAGQDRRQRYELRGIRLGATSDGLKAFEHRIEGKSYGFFTWNLLASMARSSSDETWRDILNRTRALMTEMAFYAQEPQIEGNGLLTVDFGQSQGKVSTTTVLAREGSRWVLGAGRIININPGCVLTGGPEGGRTRLQVEEATAFEAYARKLDGPDPKTGDPYRVTQYVLDQAALRLAVIQEAKNGQDQGWIEQIEGHIRRNFERQIEITRQGPVDWQLWLVRRDLGDKGVFDVPNSLPDGSLELWLTNEKRQPLVNGPILELTGKSVITSALTDALERCLKRESLLRINDFRREKDFEFNPIFFREGKPEESGLLSIARGKYGQWLPRKKATLPIGTVVTYKLKNLSEDRRYIYIVGFGPSGKVRTVFPDKRLHDEVALFQPGQKKEVPLRWAMVFNRPGFERLRVISSIQKIDPYVFEEQAVTRGREKKKYLHPLAPFLSGRRGEGQSEMLVDEWSTALYTFRVE